MSIAGKIKNCDNCGFQSSIFRFLKPEDKTLIEKNRYELVFQPGETIFKQGAACTHVASFSRGLAKMYIEGSGGKNLIIRFVRAQEFLAGIGVFYDDKHHYSVGAIDRSYLCFIEKNTFIEILRRNTAFSEAYLKQSQEAMAYTLQRMLNINQKQQQGRVAEALLYLSNDIYKSPQFTLSITKSELADMAGISRESSTKIIKGLCNEKIICMNGKNIKINEPDLLQQISDRG